MHQEEELKDLQGRELTLFQVYCGFVIVAWFFLHLFLLAKAPINRSPQSRAKADLRSIATSLEAYLSDFHTYPPPAEGNLLNFSLLTFSGNSVQSGNGLDPFKASSYCEQNYIAYWFRRLLPPEILLEWSIVILIGALMIPVAGILFRKKCYKEKAIRYLKLMAPFVLGVTFFTTTTAYWNIADTPSHVFYCPGVKNWGEEGEEFYYFLEERVVHAPHHWALVSIGPDGDLDMSWDDLHETSYSGPSYYDPTNGTLSSGDIIRTGKGQLN